MATREKNKLFVALDTTIIIVWAVMLTMYIANKPDISFSGQKISVLKSLVFKSGNIKAHAKTQSQLLAYYLEKGGEIYGEESLHLLKERLDYYDKKFFEEFGNELNTHIKILREDLINETIYIINRIRNYHVVEYPKATFHEDLKELEKLIQRITIVSTADIDKKIQDLEEEGTYKMEMFGYTIHLLFFLTFIRLICVYINLKNDND